MKNNEKGRSMIEMLGVLAIIGVLSVGGIAGYSKAMAKFRANKTIDQISHLVANTRILFGSQKDYSDLGTKETESNPYLLATAKIIPDEMRKAAVASSDTKKTLVGIFSNPYSGDLELHAVGRFKDGDSRAFIISYNNIPRDACVDLASQDWNSSSGSGLLAFAVNGLSDLTTTYDGSCTTNNAKGITCAIDMPMKVATALTACSDDTNNVLSWKFY